MRTFSALWIAYQAQQNPVWRYQTLALIDGQTYTEAEICSFSRRGGLTANEFGIGNCRIQELSITVLAKTGIAIAKNARVEVAVRITGADGNTPYYWLGTYFVDNRKQLSGGKTQLNCLDRMAYADQPFLTPGEDLDDYPMLMTTALSRIYTATGTTLDSRSTINSTWTIDYPNEMTMRQVAEQIASAHGGNFYVTEDSKLRLVKPGYTTAVAAINGSNAVRILQLNVPTTYDSVAMIYTEEGAYYESGATKLVTLNVSNSWATQAITDAAAAVIAGYTYTPMSVRSADLDPAIELGDHVTIDGVDCNILEWEWDNRFYCNLEGPSQQEDATSEFGYTGTLTQALSKKVSLGASYYGTTISRSAGLRIAKSDGSSEAVFNSDKLALRAKVGGVMTDKLYFDPATGKYMFDGALSATMIEALEAEFDITISNTIIVNNLIANKGNIAELTVDELDTSDKVNNYKADPKITTDVNYIRVYDQILAWYTAKKKESGTLPVYNRFGAQLYWIDETMEGVTEEVTAYPVTTFDYDIFQKLKISFDETDNNVPIIEMGVGVGDPLHPERGRGFITKDANGLQLKYIDTDGDEGIIQITDFVDAKQRRLKNCTINKTAGTVTLGFEGTATTVTIAYTESASGMTFTWPDGYNATVSIS